MNSKPAGERETDVSGAELGREPSVSGLTPAGSERAQESGSSGCCGAAEDTDEQIMDPG